MFDADRPITNSEQDHLNRSLFAKYLARNILDHQDPESLVIGIYGGWGSGKTSLINLALEELNRAASNMLDEEKPIVLNFSPWSYSGQNQLIYSFFRRLSSALRSVDYLENAERIIHLLELYVSFFTQKPVPKPFQPKRSWLENLRGKSKEDYFAWEAGRDLTLVKAELNQLLRHQKHKIIIVIDNISRLYDQEVKQIFQIVKSMGDYANTVYMLALDKDHVIKSINRIDGSGGNEFIEKIVQLPFELPAIDQQDLEKILFDRLQNIFMQVPKDAWNKDYWADIYCSGMKNLFTNCRDITRYVNTLSFGYTRVRDIVDPVDYFALTAVEVFLPEIFVGIRDNKDLFTDLLDNVYILDKSVQQKDQLRCDEIMARNKKIPRETLLPLLCRLFPRLYRIYEPALPFYHSETMARKNRRICSPDIFDVYFRLAIPEERISHIEFSTLLKLTTDKEAFDQALARLNQDNRIVRFLDLIDTHALTKVTPEQAPAIINALLDNGDLFPEGLSNPLSLTTPLRIHRIIHRLLHHFPDPAKRFALLQEAISKATKSIYIIVHELQEQGREHQEGTDTFLPLSFRDITPEQLESLKKQAIERFLFWSQSGRLAEHPKLLAILYAWKEWDSEHRWYPFLENMVRSDRGLIAFLQAVLQKPIDEAMTQYAKKASWRQNLNTLESFIPAKNLEKHAVTLFEDLYFEKLREREQLALMIFLDLIEAKTTKVIPKTSV